MNGILYGLILAGSLVRFYTAFTINPIYAMWSDPGRHWNWALMTVSSNPWNATDPILYQLWLNIVANLTQGGPRAIALYTGLLSAATPWLWYRFFRELFPLKRTALVGWVLIGWLPSWIGIYGYFMTETLLLPLLGLSLWFTWRSFRKRTLEAFIWATFIWSAAVMTKPTVAPLALVSIGFLWWNQNEKAPRAFWAALIGMCFLLPVAYRTHRIIGVWDPLGCFRNRRIILESGRADEQITLLRSGTPVSAYYFIVPSILSHPFEPLSSWKTARTGHCEYAIDLDAGPRDWNAALQKFKSPWSLRLRSLKENIIFILWDKSWPDSNPAHFWEKLEVYMRWCWAPLLLAVVIGDIRWFRKNRAFSLLPALNLLGWFLICTLPVTVAEARFRKPFEGLLLANALWLMASARRIPPAQS